MFHEAIKAVVKSYLSDIHTALPAQIEEYDFTTQKATVKPMIKKVYSDGVELTLPKVVCVPVAFVRSGEASITLPIKKGDTGLLIFCEKSLDIWLSKGGDYAPNSTRKFDLSDAIFFPGIFPFNQKSYSENDTDLLIYFNGFKIKIHEGKISIGKDGVELLDLIDNLLQALIQSTVATQAGPQLLSKVLDGTIASIKTDLNKIKGVL